MENNQNAELLVEVTPLPLSGELATRSLRDRIALAKNESELVKLLEEGRKYEFASDKSKRRWKEAAQKARESF